VIKLRRKVIDRATQLKLQGYGTSSQCIDKACSELNLSRKQFIKSFI